MQTSAIDHQAEAEELIEKLRGQPSVTEVARILEQVHRLGVWSRGSILTRGSLSVPAPPRLTIEKLKLVRTFVQKGLGESCHKALLVVGQWAGEESLDEPIALLGDPHMDKEMDGETPSYCLSVLRYIGGPKAVAAIVNVLNGSTGDDSLRLAAIRAIRDLASGGSVSDIDTIANPAAGIPSVVMLHSELLSHLHSALDRICEDSSFSFSLRFHAAEALELLAGC